MAGLTLGASVDISPSSNQQMEASPSPIGKFQVKVEKGANNASGTSRERTLHSGLDQKEGGTLDLLDGDDGQRLPPQLDRSQVRVQDRANVYDFDGIRFMACFVDKKKVYMHYYILRSIGYFEG